MKTFINRKKTLNILFILTLLLTFAFTAYADEEADVGQPEDTPVGISMTVTGVVNESYQIEGDDGVLYEIDEGEVGDELVQRIGEKVRVKGTVVEEYNQNFITVTSYKVINE